MYGDLLCLQISFEIEVCLLPHLIPCLVEKGLSGRSILLYSHGCLWFIILLFDRYLNHQHYVSRSNGYLEFHRKTRLLRKIPLGVQSAGTYIFVGYIFISLICYRYYCQCCKNRETFCNSFTNKVQCFMRDKTL